MLLLLLLLWPLLLLLLLLLPLLLLLEEPSPCPTALLRSLGPLERDLLPSFPLLTPAAAACSSVSA